MWQRWNTTSHVFEKSVDNGVTWSLLPIHASNISEGSFSPASLPANLAYEDEANIYTQDQRFSKASPTLVLQDTVAPTDAKNFRIINTGQQFYIQTMNDAGAILTSPLTANRAGDVSIGRYIYERGRSTPIGGRQNITPTIRSDVGTVISAGSNYFAFSLVGLVLHWTSQIINYTLPAATAHIQVAQPAGLVPIFQETCVVRLYVPTVGYEIGVALTDGDGWIRFYRNSTVNFPAGVGHLYGQGFYYIG